jgi:hypothetical protein
VTEHIVEAVGADDHHHQAGDGDVVEQREEQLQWEELIAALSFNADKRKEVTNVSGNIHAQRHVQKPVHIR